MHTSGGSGGHRSPRSGGNDRVDRRGDGRDGSHTRAAAAARYARYRYAQAQQLARKRMHDAGGTGVNGEDDEDDVDRDPRAPSPDVRRAGRCCSRPAPSLSTFTAFTIAPWLTSLRVGVLCLSLAGREGCIGHGVRDCRVVRRAPAHAHRHSTPTALRSVAWAQRLIHDLVYAPPRRRFDSSDDDASAGVHSTNSLGAPASATSPSPPLDAYHFRQFLSPYASTEQQRPGFGAPVSGGGGGRGAGDANPLPHARDHAPYNSRARPGEASPVSADALPQWYPNPRGLGPAGNSGNAGRHGHAPAPGIGGFPSSTGFGGAAGGAGGDVGVPGRDALPARSRNGHGGGKRPGRSSKAGRRGGHPGRHMLPSRRLAGHPNAGTGGGIAQRGPMPRAVAAGAASRGVGRAPGTAVRTRARPRATQRVPRSAAAARSRRTGSSRKRGAALGRVTVLTADAVSQFRAAAKGKRKPRARTPGATLPTRRGGSSPRKQRGSPRDGMPMYVVAVDGLAMGEFQDDGDDARARSRRGASGSTGNGSSRASGLGHGGVNGQTAASGQPRARAEGREAPAGGLDSARGAPQRHHGVRRAGPADTDAAQQPPDRHTRHQPARARSRGGSENGSDDPRGVPESEAYGPQPRSHALSGHTPHRPLGEGPPLMSFEPA